MATLAVVLAACSSGSVAYSGPDDGELFNASTVADVAFAASAEGGASVADIVVVHNGDVVAAVERADVSVSWQPGEFADGEHTVAFERRVEGKDAKTVAEWSFSVDATPPTVEVISPTSAVVAGAPFTVTGITEPGATVSLQDIEVVAEVDGTFELEFASAAAGDLELVATDTAGNSTDGAFDIFTVPSRVTVDKMRGVHMTAHAWAHKGLRENVMQMVDDGKINTIALTLKDEGGRIGWNAKTQLAIDTGANEGVYDLEATVAELHAKGVHVVGRIVAFRDPKLGPWARDNGKTDWLVHNIAGHLHTGKYECCFTNPAQPEVQNYLLDIAEEAAAAGVDSILWDYIRKPDGPRSNLVYPGIPNDEPLEPYIIEFTRIANERLAKYGVEHGASLYGIAADRPTQIAQDVPGMSMHLDYVSPMIYPSHWGPGEYKVKDPNRQPYDIITATLTVWQEAVAGTNTRIAPWLEDTAYRAWDRPFQTKEQIRAAKDKGVDEWLMWDPSVKYTPSVYEKRN